MTCKFIFAFDKLNIVFLLLDKREKTMLKKRLIKIKPVKFCIRKEIIINIRTRQDYINK